MKLLIIAILTSLFSLNFLAGNSSEQKNKISYFEKSLRTVEGVIQVDFVRRSSNQKVLKILDIFNPGLRNDLKQEIANEIYKMSVKYPNLDVNLICATITHESARTWDPKVVSKAGAMGLMQIMPATGEWLSKYEGISWTGAEEVLFDPIYNIRLGTRYLSALIETYDLEGGLAAYNGGDKRVKLWLANDKADGILWPETRAYIPFVLNLYDEFKSKSL
ncbi:lytic transglycosylase domain-containing protein [candidate division KSB1 bacterium]|nr:lytic transglycosylase domain-containing protein [candidate division KSB1 bacterium]MCH7673545.1 lytic transglycosylase domain-containing protein [candidate division KSB1 bacterium]MCH8018635.1 lytic transglycosylase domain-containing protein [candidate division KSB1 bacterium]MCH8956728.1 lytic transglycosylase domain-containing protein [candidate division KSB1 bacterium]